MSTPKAGLSKVEGTISTNLKKKWLRKLGKKSQKQRLSELIKADVKG